MKNYLLMLLCLFIIGCATYDVPLIEGEIPYKLEPGIYQDIHGAAHKVASETPRWSVSEAYIYTSVAEEEPESKIEKFKGLAKGKKDIIIFGIAILIGSYITRKRK